MLGQYTYVQKLRLHVKIRIRLCAITKRKGLW